MKNAEELLLLAGDLAQPRRQYDMRKWQEHFDRQNSDRNAVYDRINKLPKDEQDQFMKFMEQWELQDALRKQKQYMDQIQQHRNNQMVPPGDQWQWTPPGQPQRPLRGPLT